MKKRKTIIIIGAILAVLIIIAALFIFVNAAETYEFPDSAYQPYYKSGIEYEAGTMIAVSDNGKLYVKTEKTGIPSASDSSQSAVPELPIYFKDQKRILLPETMAYYCELNPMAYKIDQLSEVKLDENEFIVAENYDRNKEERLNGGFLFDGKDIYILLEPMTITLNGSSFVLPEFSYIEAVNNNGVIIWNYDTQEAILRNPDLDITAAPLGGEYTISLLADSMSYPNGFDLLLFANTNDLSSLFDL